MEAAACTNSNGGRAWEAMRRLQCCMDQCMHAGANRSTKEQKMGKRLQLRKLPTSLQRRPGNTERSHLHSMTPAKHYPLHRVTDDDWNAVSIFGRLRIVAHEAFLYAGFLPHGAPAASRWSFSCRYSPPPLARRRGVGGGDAAAVVMRLTGRGRRRERRSYMAVQTYVVGRDGGRAREQRLRLPNAYLYAALSGGVGDMARALRSPGSAGAWLWQKLADELGLCLFFHACRVKDVPAKPGFASLPGDVKAVILQKLDNAKDLAMAECASKELRDLVAEHHADLWKAMYQRSKHRHRCFCVLLLGDFCCSEEEENISWKQRFVRAKTCEAKLSDFDSYWGRMFDGFENSILPPAVTVPSSRRRKPPAAAAVPVDGRGPHEMLRVVKANNEAGHAPSCFKAQCNGCRRRHGAGATHSPSSRYRWKHR
ncbi:hypothetical protein ACP70R_020713 [Stipagrostis hirtigluma subsp. patula]